MPELTWQQKLEAYKSDPKAAQQEILRAKQVYEQEKAKGASPERLKQISHWADQVRSASGIANDDPTYGNDPRTYGKKPAPSFMEPPPMFRPPDLSNAGLGASPELMKMLMGMFAGSSGVSPDMQNMARDMAQRQAAEQRKLLEQQLRMHQLGNQDMMNQFMFSNRQLAADRAAAMRAFQQNLGMLNAQKAQEAAQLKHMLAQLAINRDTGLQGVKDSLEDSKQALEHRSFQDYLESRQSIANRGLSGSGIAADADTRLALARQQQLAGLQRDAARREADIQAKYAAGTEKAKMDEMALEQQFRNNLMKLMGQNMDANARFANMSWKNNMDRISAMQKYQAGIAPIFDKMKNLNPVEIERELLAEMQGDADKANVERMKVLSGLIGKFLPYDAPTMGQILQNQLGYDKLNSGNLNSFFGRQFNLYKLQELMKQKDEDQIIQWARVAGVLPDGSPTLDARKLAQQQAYQEQLIELRRMGLINDKEYREAMLNLYGARLELDVDKFNEQKMQSDYMNLIRGMQRIDAEMGTLVDAMGKSNDPVERQNMQRRLNELQRQKMLMMDQFTGTPTESPMIPPTSFQMPPELQQNLGILMPSLSGRASSTGNTRPITYDQLRNSIIPAPLK